MNQDSQKRRAFKHLGDYMKNNIRSLSPKEIVNRISIIQRIFGLASHTGMLARQVISNIRLLESNGSLTEYSLISLALMMVYDRFYDSVPLKRVVIEAYESGFLRSTYPKPASRSG